MLLPRLARLKFHSAATSCSRCSGTHRSCGTESCATYPPPALGASCQPAGNAFFSLKSGAGSNTNQIRGGMREGAPSTIKVKLVLASAIRMVDEVCNEALGCLFLADVWPDGAACFEQTTSGAVPGRQSVDTRGVRRPSRRRGSGKRALDRYFGSAAATFGSAGAVEGLASGVIQLAESGPSRAVCGPSHAVFLEAEEAQQAGSGPS